MPNSIKLAQDERRSLWLFQDMDGSLSLCQRVEQENGEFGEPLIVVPPQSAASLAFALLETLLTGHGNAAEQLRHLLAEHDIPHIVRDVPVTDRNHPPKRP